MIEFAPLYEKIREADSIVIFRHVNPDCDAAGSQFGLKRWISDNFPEKKVYAAGTQKPTQGIWPDCDEIDDSVIEDSLAIVLDTATRERADDDRFLKAKEIIKIDHHPAADPYGSLNIVQTDAAAVCEILAYFFQTAAMKVSSETASYIYKGLLTDTLRFSTSNTTSATLSAAAFIAGFGIDIPSLNRELFDLNMSEFRLTSLIRSKVQFNSCGFAWVILSAEELAEYEISGSGARGHIDEIGHVQDFRIWAMFTERITEEGVSVFDGSLRSKRAAVNTIAADFGGGGHTNAAGVKNLSEADVKSICEKLTEAAAGDCE